MTTYYQARISDKGRWYYTRKHDGQVHKIGYCIERCPGHRTQREAELHQRMYDLNDAIAHGSYTETRVRPCLGCGIPTPFHYAVGPGIADPRYPVCPDHGAVEVRQLLDDHYETPTQVISPI